MMGSCLVFDGIRSWLLVPRRGHRDTLHVRLDPATAPRRSKAFAALCADLTATVTTYPDTDTELILAYGIKGQPDPA